MAKGQGFSLRTKDATEGGGIEGAMATVAEIGFVDEFTYGGRQKDRPQAALRVEYHIEGFQKPWEQHYSLGPSDKYEVVLDGYGVTSTGKQQGLNKKSSAFAFFSALEEAAQDQIEDLCPEEDGVFSVKPLEGIRVRLTNAKFTTVSGDTKDLVVIGSIEEDAPAPAKGRGGKAAASDFDVEDYTENAIVALLEDKSPLKKSDLANMVFQADRKHPQIKAAMQLALKDVWVFGDDRPWDADRKKGTIRARE